ncbi:MAG: GAF domain-containing protein, partial [bacterium]|nr:GAF domain-containing protein [bacterium]
LITVAVNYIVTSLEIKETTFIILFTLVVAMIIFPLFEFVRRRLNRKLFSGKAKYIKSFEALLIEMQGMISMDELLLKMSAWLESGMEVSPVLVCTLGTTGNCPGVLCENFSTEEEWSFLRFIKDGSVFFWDELLDTKSDTVTVKVDEKEQEWARENSVSLTVPMIASGSPAGLLNIGKPTNGEDFTGQDIAVFKEIASKAAITLQRLQLQTESIERERLAGDLEVARRIQEQLLPLGIPVIKGLTLYGKTVPCLE